MTRDFDSDGFDPTLASEYDRLDKLRTVMWNTMSALEQRHIANLEDSDLEKTYRKAEEDYYALEKQCSNYRDQ